MNFGVGLNAAALVLLTLLSTVAAVIVFAGYLVCLAVTVGLAVAGDIMKKRIYGDCDTQIEKRWTVS